MGNKASLRWLIPVASAALGLGLAVPAAHASMPGVSHEWPWLSVTGRTATTVSLDWLDAVVDVAVDHYAVWRGDASFQNATQVATVGAATSYWTDTQLTPSTTYTYLVRAWDSAGQQFSSNHVTVTTDASPPRPSADRPSVDPNTPVSGFTQEVFFDEFDGTSLDTTKWRPNWFGEGGVKNNVGTYAANVTESGGAVHLKLASTSSGALIRTDYWDPNTYKVAVGDYVEARIYFPGNDTTEQAYNWPAFWINGTAKWPRDGEHDVAEGLGQLAIVYHGKGINTTPYFPPGHWVNGWHVYGLHRKAGSADVYWDGTMVRSYKTRDSGRPEEIIFNIGQGQGGPTVVGQQIDVDWVRAWRP